MVLWYMVILWVPFTNSLLHTTLFHSTTYTTLLNLQKIRGRDKNAYTMQCYYPSLTSPLIPIQSELDKSPPKIFHIEYMHNVEFHLVVSDHQRLKQGITPVRSTER